MVKRRRMKDMRQLLLHVMYTLHIIGICLRFVYELVHTKTISQIVVLLRYNNGLAGLKGLAFLNK
jgi:hypothetical protein